MNKYLIFEGINTTRKAAIACYRWIGRGKEKDADQAAVDSMRTELNKIDFDGKIVIGEGERDKAPMLYIGEKVGKGTEQVDIALDPLEGTTICANAGFGALSVLAFANKNCLLNAPDVYMDKIAIGPDHDQGIINLDNPPSVNLNNLAKSKGVKIEELSVMILKRERHNKIIQQVRDAGAKVKLIDDGDISAVIAAATKGSGVDMYLGKGGAPEGVLAAAALKAIGGQFQGRLCFSNSDEINRAKNMGIKDPNQKYNLEDLVKGDTIFFATGVTDGYLAQGIKQESASKYTTETLVLCSKTKTSFKIIQRDY